MKLILSPAQRSALRSRAHALNPVVTVSDAGLSASVMNEIDRNLASHELIKIRVFSSERMEREKTLDEICDALAAAPIQHIGKILVVYRPLPENQRPAAKKTRPRRKPPRRTKRSFQY